MIHPCHLRGHAEQDLKLCAPSRALEREQSPLEIAQPIGVEICGEQKQDVRFLGETKQSTGLPDVFIVATKVEQDIARSECFSQSDEQT